MVSQKPTLIIPVRNVHYVNIANYLYAFDEKKLCRHKYILVSSLLLVEAILKVRYLSTVYTSYFDTFNVSLYNVMLFCVETGAPIFCIGLNTLRKILRASYREDIPREVKTSFSTWRRICQIFRIHWVDVRDPPANT